MIGKGWQRERGKGGGVAGREASWRRTATCSARSRDKGASRLRREGSPPRSPPPLLRVQFLLYLYSPCLLFYFDLPKPRYCWLAREKRATSEDSAVAFVSFGVNRSGDWKPDDELESAGSRTFHNADPPLVFRSFFRWCSFFIVFLPSFLPPVFFSPWFALFP